MCVNGPLCYMIMWRQNELTLELKTFGVVDPSSNTVIKTTSLSRSRLESVIRGVRIQVSALACIRNTVFVVSHVYLSVFELKEDGRGKRQFDQTMKIEHKLHLGSTIEHLLAIDEHRVVILYRGGSTSMTVFTTDQGGEVLYSHHDVGSVAVLNGVVYTEKDGVVSIFETPDEYR